MFCTPQYHTACQMQKKILEAMGLEFQQANQTPKPSKGAQKLKPAEIANLVKAWDTLENRKRILRNKPLPKSVEVKEKPKDRKAATFSE